MRNPFKVLNEAIDNDSATAFVLLCRWSRLAQYTPVREEGRAGADVVDSAKTSSLR